MAQTVEPAPARGLTTAEATQRQRLQGPNTLPSAPRPKAIALLFGQLTHFFALMLWVAAGLALVAGMPALAVAIAVVIVLNGVFAFVQEHRADRAAERLRDLLPVNARVRRDGRVSTVPATDLVVGDRVVIEAGDRVCADSQLHLAHRLEVDESMLTGESRPASLEPGQHALAGTYVVAGQGEAIVTAIAAQTRLAALAAVTEQARRPQSPLARQLHRVVRIVAAIALTVGVVSFAAFTAFGRPMASSLMFSIGVTVALVPEGLLPTVTLSLARAAQRMATVNALVRRLESVETLGATTFICTDKTGTLTRNEMQAVHVWTPEGGVVVDGSGYSSEADLAGSPSALAAAAAVAESASRCSPDADVRLLEGRWQPVGDPLEVAFHVLADRLGVATAPSVHHREPFDNHLRRSSATDDDGVHITGAPESVMALCDRSGPENATNLDVAADQLSTMTQRGLRVIAVARASDPDSPPRLLGLVGLTDPPRAGVADAIRACRRAGVKVAMVTGDHPATASAIATEVGLSGPGQPVVVGSELPADDAAMAALLDRDGVVVARVAPEQKLRIARALQHNGHVVAMTGDGVNDGPALRAADIGIAMGASGTDVAREASDLVLLDDHFGTIVAAIQLGRATFANIRRFLTYHLTDNVAELAPFAVWAASGGAVPLGFTVLQILALDIGTDLLPALALGAEPPNPRTMTGPARSGSLLDHRVLRRAFLVLGPAEAGLGMLAFVTILVLGGWTPSETPDPHLLATASGTLFAAVALGQLTNAFACRSEARWIGAVGFRGNPLLLAAVAVELVLLGAFLWLPPLPELLGGSAPGWTGWLAAAAAIPVLIGADGADKAMRARSRRRSNARCH